MVKRILTISKPYVSRPYRRKLQILAEDPRYAMGLICPEQWGNQRFEPALPEDGKLWIRSLPTYFSSNNHLHLYKQLQRAVEEFAPDILNVEEEDYSMVTWQAFRAARKLGARPMFYAWQNIDKNYPPPFSNIEQYVYRHAASAMVGSATAGKILQRKGYKGPFFVVPQIGIDTELFHLEGDVGAQKKRIRADLGLDPDQFTVFFGGRIVAEKGIQTLIKAAENLGRPDLHVVIIGSGPYLDELKRLAADASGINITFIPYVTTSDMPRYIQAADALCLASLTRPNWKEQGPVRIVTESMAAQTVVIVSDSGELPDVVGDSGMIFPEGDAVQLADQLARLMEDRNLVAQLRLRAIQKVTRQYSATAVARQCAGIFDAI